MPSEESGFLGRRENPLHETGFGDDKDVQL